MNCGKPNDRFPDRIRCSICQKKHNEKYHRIFFDTPFLRHPNWMSLQALPKENVSYLDKLVEFMEAHPENPETFVGIRDFQLARMKRVRDWMKQEMPEAELKKARADHYLFFREHDRRRATNYLETFPEYEKFWKICEQAAQ